MGKFWKQPSEKRVRRGQYRQRAIEIKKLFMATQISLLKLPDEILFKIIEYVAAEPLVMKKVKEKRLSEKVKTKGCEVDVRTNPLLSLQLVCCRMKSVFEKYANHLPKIPLSKTLLQNLRIKFARIKDQVPYVFLYRYGNAHVDKPCVFVKLEHIPHILIHYKICGTVFIDKFTINDELISVLLSIDWSSVGKFAFWNLNGINLRAKELMSELMMRLRHVWPIRLSGVFEASDLYRAVNRPPDFYREPFGFDGWFNSRGNCYETFEKCRFWNSIREARSKRRTKWRVKTRISWFAYDYREHRNNWDW